MDKAQAIHNFWSGFDLPAFDEIDVPDKLDGRPVEMPYITYNVYTDSLDGMLTLNASIWYRETTWKNVTKKAEEIAEYIVKMSPPSIEIDNGRLYLTKGTPFAQRLSDEDDMVKRIYLMVNAEFLTAY